jgi:hypothetical protein
MSNNITSFDDLFEAAVDPDGIISSFISGHLMVEFMLVKVIEISSPKLLDFAEDLNHFRLVKLANGLELITDSQADLILKINKVRNKFAHNITYRPTVNEIKQLFTIAKQNFSDMTDGLEQGIGELEGKTKIEECEPYIFSDLFIHIAYDLHEIYQTHGGEIIEFKMNE